MIIRSFWYLFSLPRISQTLTYMLQNTEYQVWPYLKWFWRTQDFSKVLYRRQLVPTRAARLIRLGLIAGMLLQIFVALVLIGLGLAHKVEAGQLFGLALLISYPLVWAHLIVVPLELGRIGIEQPKQQRLIGSSRQIFADHSAIKIAVAGSYGKTSMKELLLTVLSEGLRVAATPANKNVASSHAAFARGLSGDEAVLIIEYGEGGPGDVRRFAETTQPTHGIITGLAPAHLDKYKTLERAAEDIVSLADYLGDRQVYYNAESSELIPFVVNKTGLEAYDQRGVLGWKVQHVVLSPTATSFELKKGKTVLKLTSGLLGKHQLGPLSLAAALGLEFGMNERQVKAGIAKTKPFEHRMQPYQLGGAWIIDDTYNGNIEGIRVGTELLASLPAQRKWYVTPGLVDQGKQSKAVHQRLGELVANAKPDIVVLMKNSATAYIQQGLEAAGFNGELRIEHRPLEFYTNLGEFVAHGDLVLMQNDWTDNYV